MDHSTGSSVSPHNSLTYTTSILRCVVYLPGCSNVHSLCFLLPNFPCKFSEECKARVSHSSASINFIPTFHCLFHSLHLSLSLSVFSRWLKWRLTLQRPARRPLHLSPPPPPPHPPLPSILPFPTSMDLKDRRHRSLTRSRCSKDSQFNTSSLDTDECRVPTQKSYSSSETLKAFDHEQRLHYGGCVTDLVHHEADEYSRQGGFVLHNVPLRFSVHSCSGLEPYSAGLKT